MTVQNREIAAKHEQFPRATLVALDRAGHGVMLEYPALFQSLFRNWLLRMEESIQHTNENIWS